MAEVNLGGSYVSSTKQSFPSDVEHTAETTNNDNVNHPHHYNREGAMECIDELELIFGPEMVMYFCLGNVFKYRYRARDKNGQEDLKKSDWYMKKYKEYKEKVNEKNKEDEKDSIAIPWTNKEDKKDSITIPWTINPTIPQVTYTNYTNQACNGGHLHE